MSVLDDLKRLSAAEDFFRYLDVAFEPHVLDVARLHILKLMGQLLAKEAAMSADDELRARCRAHLQSAYQHFALHTPLEERLFKVHKDAVAERAAKPTPLISLTPLRKDGSHA